ncbi:hypothetical protein MTP99_005937 [Tenebrio molitor]|nr:hypothetical protein MTP99_005937 [Tenebrio molitor]
MWIPSDKSENLSRQWIKLYKQRFGIRYMICIKNDGTISKSWQDNNVKSVRKTKVEGKRYIIVHAGNSDGFIEGAELIFSSSTKKECPLTKFQQGFSKLHLLTEDALNWLQQIKNI